MQYFQKYSQQTEIEKNGSSLNFITFDCFGLLLFLLIFYTLKFLRFQSFLDKTSKVLCHQIDADLYLQHLQGLMRSRPMSGKIFMNMLCIWP